MLFQLSYSRAIILLTCFSGGGLSDSNATAVRAKDFFLLWFRQIPSWRSNHCKALNQRWVFRENVRRQRNYSDAHLLHQSVMILWLGRQGKGWRMGDEGVGVVEGEYCGPDQLLVESVHPRRKAMRAHAQRNARMQHAYTDALTHLRPSHEDTATILQLTERVAGGDGSPAPLGCRALSRRLHLQPRCHGESTLSGNTGLVQHCFTPILICWL